MTESPGDRKIRAALPLIRFSHAYLPLRLARWLNQQSVERVQLPANVRRAVISLEGVESEWLIPQGSPDEPVLLYLHGGSFILGLTSLHFEMVAYLAQKLGVRAALVDYRLAPEHPFPAALEDCLTAYRWLLKQGIPARNILLAGDSAGGNLALSTLMSLRDSGEPLPAAAALLSPVADLTGRGSRFREIHDPLLHPRAARFAERSYVARRDPRTPTISPVFGDWGGLPPLLIHAGEDEVLREDAQRAAELAQEAGVPARLEIYPRMWHVWQLFLSVPQATQALEEIVDFLTSHLGSGPATAAHADRPE